MNIGTNKQNGAAMLWTTFTEHNLFFIMGEDLESCLKTQNGILQDKTPTIFSLLSMV